MAKALIIDSSAPSMREALFQIESLGFEVTAAYSADEALVPADRQAPDLILVDAKIGGAGLIEALRKRHPSACLLFITGDGGPATIRAAMEAGSDDYLVKPFDRELLAFKLVQAQARGRLGGSATGIKLVQDNAASTACRLGAGG